MYLDYKIIIKNCILRIFLREKKSLLSLYYDEILILRIL